MNYREKVSSDVTVTGIVNIGIRFQGLIFIPLIGKSLGIDAYGAYIQIIAITGLLAGVLNFGLPAALIRYSQAESQDMAELYYSLTTFAVACGIAAAIIIGAFSTLLVKLTLGDTAYTGALLIGTLLIPFKIFTGMARNYFRAQMRVKTYSIIEGVRSYVSIGVVAVIILWLGLGLRGVLFGLVLTELVTAGLIQIRIGQQIGYTVPKYSELRRSLVYSVPLTMSSIADQLSSRADRLLIGYFLGASAVGIYSIAYSIANFMTVYSVSVYASFFPEISRLIEEKNLKLSGQMIKAGIRYFIIIAVPSGVGLYLIGPRVITVISTPAAASFSELLVPVIAAGIIMYGTSELFAIIPTVNQDTLAVTKIRLASAVTNIGMNLVLIPSHGIFGAAIATLASYGISVILMYRRSNVWISIPFPWSIAAKTIISSGVMFAVSHFILRRQILSTILLSPLVYFILLIILRGISVSEVRELINLDGLSIK